MRKRGLERAGGRALQAEAVVCAKSLSQKGVCHTQGTGRGLLYLECSYGRPKGGKNSLLREGHTLTKPTKDSYRNPSVKLLMGRKNSNCQVKSLSSQTSTLSPSRKFPVESQITIMILLDKLNTGLVDPLVIYFWLCSSKDLGRLIKIYTP